MISREEEILLPGEVLHIGAPPLRCTYFPGRLSLHELDWSIMFVATDRQDPHEQPEAKARRRTEGRASLSGRELDAGGRYLGGCCGGWWGGWGGEGR